MRTFLLHTLLYGASLGATTTNGALRLFESIAEAPQEWNDIGRPDPNTELSLSILLTPEDPNLLEKTLYEVSTPGNSRYGQYLEQLDIKSIIKPAEESKKNVLAWLESSGAKITSDSGEKIRFLITVDTADSMLGTRFRTYKSASDPTETKIRTLKVMVPHNIAAGVDLIHPTTYFDNIQPLKSIIHSSVILDTEAAKETKGCGTVVTPACLEEIYYMKGFTIKNPNKAGRIGVPGFLNQIARFKDLDQFIRTVPSRAKPGTNFTFTNLNDGTMNQNSRASATEANLDIQYTVALTSPLRNHFYSVGKKGPLIPDLDQPNVANSQNEPYQEFFQHILEVEDKAKVPHTISISYGENEQNVPASYSQAVCNQIAQLGLRGVSVLSGSGDWGVGSSCQTNDGTNRTWFTPIFPASCPYITSVGGTTGWPERAVGFSSGGFSDRFPRPPYQEAQVSGFIKEHGSQWAKYYNTKGRGFPDISAQAQGFRIIDGGKVSSIGGTSASAPVVSSIIALLNAKRLEDGQPPLGFLNPWLYSVDTKIATDITQGKSIGCTGRSVLSYKTTPKVNGANWPAVKGWDPVTGIGTPKFAAMLQNLPKAKAAGRN